MVIYIIVLMCLFFLLTIANAVKFGDTGKLSDFIDTVLFLGFAIWGLILIVLNWS